jgi:hypothetical protein
MVANIAAAAGSGQIQKFSIIANTKEVQLSTDFLPETDVEISGGILELLIFQSCLDTSVRATATFVDTGYRPGSGSVASIERDDLDLTAGEKTTLIINDGFGNKLSFSDKHHLRVQQLRDVTESTNKNVFTLDFYSEESINNELEKNRVKKRYDGKISDSVYSILNETLRTEKNIFIDEVINKFNFLGNNEKPFYKIPWLGARSVPNFPKSIGNFAGYFFYETPDDGNGNGGFHFKSIDKFFTQEPKYKLISNDVPYLPVGYDKKILSYSIDSCVNLDTSIKTGSLTNTVLKTFNPFTKKYSEERTFSNVGRFDFEHMGGMELPKIASDLNLWGEATNVDFKMSPISVLPSGSNLKEQTNYAEEQDWDVEGIVRQSVSRYNNLFNSRLNIVIAGDFSIYAGDILSCDFPEISGKASKIVSNKKSGNYLVIDVAHRISSIGCFTSINLVRESIYKS